jgi:putative tryptophan/tyrosine transport system substrate-binding protein
VSVMNRRAFLGTLAVFAAPLAAGAQQTGTIHRIGYLSTDSAAGPRPVEAFRHALRELGWVEGQNIVIERRFAEGRFDRLPDLATELVRLKVEVIVAGVTPAAVAAKNATRTIPIVMFGVGDPVGLGLVASLGRPGGNVTGLSFSVGMDTFGKALELLKETLPKVRRLAVLWNPANPAHAAATGNVKAAATSLAMQLQLLEAREPNEFEGAFAVMAKQRVDALLIVSDGMFVLHRARLTDLAIRNRLPSMHAVREMVEAGGLMSYGPSIVVAWRRAAFFVDRILKGANPADLPVEQPTKFELVINLRTAKALGLTIPASLLQRADQVLE